jgi:hypothetical protein
MRQGLLYVAAGLLVTTILLVLHYTISDLGYYGKIIDGINVAVALMATVLLYRQYTKCREAPEALVLLCLSAAIGLWALAEGVWAFYEIALNKAAVQPSPADLLWLAGYVPYVYGIFIAFESIGVFRKAALIAVISYLAMTGTVLIALRNAILSVDADFLVNLVNITYVLGDTMLFSLTLPIIMAFFLRRSGVMWLLIGLAIALVSAADIWYFYLVSTGTYAPSHVVNIVYALSYQWLGVGAFMHVTQKEENENQPDDAVASKSPKSGAGTKPEGRSRKKDMPRLGTAPQAGAGAGRSEAGPAPVEEKPANVNT